MVVTYSPAGKDVYIYLTDEDPGEAARSVSEVPVRMFFDQNHQWVGFEIIELLPGGETLDMSSALERAEREAPEAHVARDPARHVVSLRWADNEAGSAEPARVLPWDAIIDFDPAGQLVGVEFLFGGALEIDGRLARLPHQRI